MAEVFAYLPHMRYASQYFKLSNQCKQQWGGEGNKGGEDEYTREDLLLGRPSKFVPSSECEEEVWSCRQIGICN